ncbi:hypothetical protein [Leisingera sp. D0M16]|uniref:hypothetical protein n=1 Tax=Leisingera coralii TaxID=3351347 RepID=UPI003BA2B448
MPVATAPPPSRPGPETTRRAANAANSVKPFEFGKTCLPTTAARYAKLQQRRAASCQASENTDVLEDGAAGEN